jgi:hypothetical protein
MRLVIGYEPSLAPITIPAGVKARLESAQEPNIEEINPILKKYEYD